MMSPTSLLVTYKKLHENWLLLGAISIDLAIGRCKGHEGVLELTDLIRPQVVGSHFLRLEIYRYMA